jgi:antitoxin component YwqK of YwqJK toxin-antitoxin module/Tfp pilus assembly protein PilF
MAYFAEPYCTVMNLAHTLRICAGALVLMHATAVAQTPPTTFPEKLTYSAEHIEKGIEAYRREQYDSSIYWYDQVYVRDTNFASASYEKALSLIKLKRYDQAIVALDKSDEAEDGNDVRNGMVRARAYHKKGDKDKAYSLIHELKKKFPYHADLYAEHAHLAFEASDWKLAQIQIDSAFRINSSYYKTHLYFSEIAYASGQPALGMLAAHFGSLSLNSASDQFELVQLLNLEADDNFTSSYPIPQNVLGSFPELEDLNQLVKSKVVFTDKYKLRLKLDEKYIRQMQLIIENLAQIEPGSHDAMSTFYLNYYKEIAAKDFFEGCILYGLDAIKEAPAVAKLLKSKKGDIEKYTEWNTEKIRKTRQENFSNIFKFGNDFVFQYYRGGQIQVFGKFENEKRLGEWTFFHPNGAMQAQGSYDNKPQKTGEWKYYFDNGQMSLKEDIDNNAGTLEYVAYYRNGNKKESGTKLRGTLDGLYTEFHPNGAKKREIDVKNGSASGMFKKYDFNGTLELEREFVNPGMPGLYVQYYGNGQKEQMATIINDKLSGVVQEWYPDGKLKEKAYFDGDKRSGWSVSYYRNGAIKDSAFYVNGKLNGVKTSFTREGKLSTRNEYKNGKINGLSTWYDDTDGKEYAHLTFKNERLASYEFLDKEGKVIFSRQESNSAIEWLRHTPYGNITEKGTYRKGEFDGDFETYYPNGSVKKKYAFVNGNVSGKYVTYHSNGNIENEAKYDSEGNLQGLQKEYYRNGKLRSFGIYVDGKREGLFTYYYQSGGIAQENWYEKGKIKASTEYHKNGKLNLNESYVDGELLEEQYFRADGSKGEALKHYAGEQNVNLSKTLGYTTAMGKFMNGGKVGDWKYYSAKDVLSSEIHYTNDKRSGKSKAYHNSGKIRSEEWYINGERDSAARYYNELGILDSETYFDLGEEQGKEHYYYADGKVQTEFNNVDDDLSGKGTMYAPDGSVIIERHYFEGQMVSYTSLNASGQKVTVPFTTQTGDVVAYYANGKLALKYTLKNGNRDGKYEHYNTDGKPLFIGFYTDGQLNGKYTDYYPDGKLLEDCTYELGMLQGEKKMYYSNGKLAFKETYVNGELNGMAEYYNEKGELVRKTNYENGYEKLP